MNDNELREALQRKAQVEYDGVIFDRISAVIYRNIKGKLEISAEIMDENSHSVFIVDPKKLNLLGGN